jgi:hypothetical protein
MSGGRYSYAFGHVTMFADAVEEAAYLSGTLDPWSNEVHPDRSTPARRAFVAHLRLVAEAMRAIEWEDSGDGADEEAAIRACGITWEER